MSFDDLSPDISPSVFKSLPVGASAYIKDVPVSFVFVSDVQDVEPIKELIPAAAQYDSFFFQRGTGDEEYGQVWGMHGIVPYNDKSAYRLK